MRNTPTYNLENPNSLTRRDLLRAGAVSLLGASLMCLGSEAEAVPRRVRAGQAVRCIVLNLTGGMSHLDTWDMKPGAPPAMRGPFQPIQTNVPGMEICEIFPRMARHADKFAIARSMHNVSFTATEALRQNNQNGRASATAACSDAFGIDAFGTNVFFPCSPFHSLTSQDCGDMPVSVTLPCTSFAAMSGSLCGASSRLTAALSLDGERDQVQDRYGRNGFGQACLRSRRLVERGARFVSVDMYPNGYDGPTWDAHGSAPFADLNAYRTHCGPEFDNAYVSLIEDLQARGLYDSTIVLATGAWGRAPLVNRHGGRARWPHCWSLLIGGGGLRGGQVIGASDDLGGYPIERPVTPADIAATLRLALNLLPCPQSARHDNAEPRLPTAQTANAAQTANIAQPLLELLSPC